MHNVLSVFNISDLLGVFERGLERHIPTDPLYPGERHGHAPRQPREQSRDEVLQHPLCTGRQDLETGRLTQHCEFTSVLVL